MTSQPQPPKQIIILGSSYAGLSLTHYLLQHVLPSLPTRQTYKIILISSSKKTLCRPACPRALLSDSFFDQSKLFVDTAGQLSRYPSHLWTFIHGKVVNVNMSERKVKVELSNDDERDFEFYSLVIATGSSTPSPLLGLGTSTSSSEDLKGAWEEFRSALTTGGGGRGKRIVIAGGGPAGVETAGEIGEYVNGRKGWIPFFSSSPGMTSAGGEKIEIMLLTSGSQILPVLREGIASTAEQYLADVGVTVVKNTKVIDVSPPDAGSTLSPTTTPAKLSLSNGEIIEADIYIPATGTTPNTSFLAPKYLTESGHIRTNKSTFRLDPSTTDSTDPSTSTSASGDVKRIYALGDSSSAFRPAIHNIIASIPILSNNIHRDILLHLSTASSKTAIPAEQHFKEDTRSTQLVPIGRSKGVGAFNGWRMPSWFVWGIKGRDYWMWTTPKLWSGKQWS